MNSKELVAALREIEPHLEGAIQQDAYLEVRVQDPSDPAKTYPLTSAKMRFSGSLDKFVIVLDVQ